MFPTRAERNGRAIAGLSMGGYGAVRYALTFPDKFCAAVSHSGALAFGHDPVGRDGNPYSTEFRRILGPDHVGGKNDLFALADKIDPAKMPALRIDCGVDDFLIEPNRRFHAHLVGRNLRHEYEEFPGAHTWDYWDRHVRTPSPFSAGT
jgi:S-formylglutathione hydrolase FrmB